MTSEASVLYGLDLVYLKQRIRDFGRKYGFVPYSKELLGGQGHHSELRQDFGYVDPAIRELAYGIKREIEDFFTEKEGVIPYHWHKVRIRMKALPSRLGYVIDKGRKVLKTVRGYMGQYVRGRRDINIHENLPELENGGDLLKRVLKHELFHSVQEEADTLGKEPHWKTEAEASMFATDGFEDLDFEHTDKWFAYRDWTLNYIRRWGKRLMTSFKKRLGKIYEYFTPWERQELGLE